MYKNYILLHFSYALLRYSTKARKYTPKRKHVNKNQVIVKRNGTGSGPLTCMFTFKATGFEYNDQ